MLIVRVGVQAPDVKVGGVADTLPIEEPAGTFPHAGASDEAGTDPTSLEHAASEKNVTVAEHDSPFGVPHVQVHDSSSSK